MTAACGLSLIISGIILPNLFFEVALGMLAPLVVAVVTIVSIERIYRREPLRLTAFMLKAFGAKMLFFPISIGTVLTLTSLQPIPFIISFSVYFIGLQSIEAWLLRSLFLEATS
jgi:hypothetical protein